MTTTWYYLSLFSGIGGLDLGLDRAGMTCVGQVERDPFCQRVLAKHWPEVPRHDDVRTAVAWWRSEPRPAVDVIVGGFPCQPVSHAGRKQAQQDHRWLWPAFADVVAEIRPAWVIGENVPGLLRRGLTDVLSDLDRLGYRARAGLISACALGAPHVRQRMFIVAHAAGVRCGAGWPEPRGAANAHRERAHAQADGRGWWTDEPAVARVAYGLSDGVDRRRTLGNAVVPQVAERVGRLVIGAAA